MTTAAERFAAAMEAAGEECHGGQWTCPVHDGSRPSISVKQEDGRILIHCHATCKTEDIVKVVGLTMTDLSDQPSTNGHKPPEPVPGPVPEWATKPYLAPGETRTVEYTDETDALLYKSVRHQISETEKTFRQEGPNGEKSVAGIRKVLAGLPDVIKAVAEGRTIHLAEGEKAAAALVFAGEVATCNSGGASNWKDELADSLKGAALVKVWEDNDDAGATWADAVTASLKSRGIRYERVKSRTANPKDDAWDHFAAGWTVADAVAVPETDPVDALITRLLTAQQLDDLQDPEPLISGVLTLDTLARVNGEPGSGKSLMALDWAAHIGLGIPWQGKAVTQGVVVYIVAEGARGFKKRKHAWEKHHGRRIDHVYFLPEPLQINGPEWETCIQACQRLGATLVVFDTQRRVTVGVKENDNTEFGVIVDRLDDLRRATGACVLLVHHTPKGGEGGSGAGAVMAGLNTEFQMTKRKNGTTTYTLENTKEKDDAEGSKMTFELEVITIGGTEGNRFDPLITSVVLVRADADEQGPPSEVDLSGLEHLNAREKLRAVLMRVWGTNGGTFTQAQAKEIVVTERKFMHRSTFYKQWEALDEEQFIRPELTDNGKRTARFFLD